MFWIILGLIFFILAILLLTDSQGGSLGLLVVIFLCGIPLYLGMSVYPDLVWRKEAVKGLKSEIETMRSAHYGQTVPGTLVGGSLDNLKQSEVLSKYIKEYAFDKARYNANLAAAKTRRNLSIYYWFGDSAFIAEDIENLEPLL